MRFSARSFSDAASAAAAAASAAGSACRAAVPLTGRASRPPPRSPRRKRSGDEQHTCARGASHSRRRLRAGQAPAWPPGLRQAQAGKAGPSL